jgi:asparagine synthase (glutamine-hydrolysing)
VDPSADRNSLVHTMDRMERALRTCAGHRCQRWVHPEGCVAIGRIGPQAVPYGSAGDTEGRGLVIWLEGELFREDCALTASESVEEIRRHWQHREYNHALSVRRLDGSFHMAVWDERRREMVLASDRFGTRPLYLGRQGKSLVFAPQVQGVLASGKVGQELDPDGLAAFLAFGSPVGDHTLMRNVSLMPPASVLIFREDRDHIDNYWHLAELFSSGEVAEEASRREIEDAFHRSIARCLSGGRRMGLLLSGGLDTRVNLAGVARRASPIHSFTYGIPGCTDVVIAERLAREAGTIHHTLELEPDFLSRWAEPLVWMTDGMLNLVHSSGISVFDEIARHADVLLVGDGGEFSRGYYHRGDALRGGPDLLPGLVRLFQKGFNLEADPAPIRKELTRELAPRARLAMKEVMGDLGTMCDGDKLDAFYLHERFRKFSVCGFVLKRNYVECRAPLMDYNFIEAAARAPRSMRGRWSPVHRLLVERAAPQLLRYPWNELGLPLSGGKLHYRVAKTIFEVRKRLSKVPWFVASPERPYARFAQWLRGPLRQWVMAVLLDDQTRRRDIFDPAGLELFLEDHMNGRRDHTEQIGLLLALELGFRHREKANGRSESCMSAI